MFPIKDDNPTEIPPIVTIGIIGVCVGVWVGLQGAGLDPDALERSVCELGAIPGELTGSFLNPGGSPCLPGGLTWGALVSSMFLHGSWAHLIGNMWFLWIFGNNIEDSMGHGRFLLFYVLAGVIAAGAHVMVDPTSRLPMVGASGAISAIMGAYLLLYPAARVKTFFVFIIIFRIISIPAWLYLGYWFLIQLASWEFGGATAGGVALWAHIGGFLAGLVLIVFFRNPQLVNAKRGGVTLPRDQIRHGGWW